MAPKYPSARHFLTISASLLAVLVAGCASTSTPYDGPSVETEEAIIKVKSRGGDDYTASIPQLGAALGLSDDRPDSYTVVRGDTLWDISGKFLDEPWRWPEVWQANPDIKNPHLIYPGDRIRLEYDADGRPKLVVSRNGVDLNFDVEDVSGNVEKLSPRIREESLEEAIPSIPGDAIRQFLVYPRVISRQELGASPYVIGNYEGRLTSAVGHEIYARGIRNRDQSSYGIFRESKVLRDPISGEDLGQEVSHVGDARLLQLGDPSTLLITSNKTETIAGDRLMSSGNSFTPHQYIPRTPNFDGEGRVVSLVDAIAQVGRNQVVVINLGERNDIEVGDVLAIERRGGRIRDPIKGRGQETVAIPNTRTGVVMVFQTFDKVSYALVMESKRPIHQNDVVTPI